MPENNVLFEENISNNDYILIQIYNLLMHEQNIENIYNQLTYDNIFKHIKNKENQKLKIKCVIEYIKKNKYNIYNKFNKYSYSNILLYNKK